MSNDFFCVDLIRSILIENIAASAIRGVSVKESFTDAVEYVSFLTGMTHIEISQFLPSEYNYDIGVVVGEKYYMCAVKKSRFELFPTVS